ncbi:hypothetical protein FACS1894204_00660 [Synergistales bacterium]|nr:hypothetical protein FACS1894204_00660 [Synergistales bacterium]
MTSEHRYIQILLDYNKYDAIGNNARIIDAMLRKEGYISYISSVGGNACDGNTLRLLSLDKFIDPARDILIYHMSIGSNVNDKIAELKALRKIMIFHNITPPEFFCLYDDNIAELCRMGKKQLRNMSEDFDLAIADSEFNASALRDYGYKNVIVVPLLVDLSFYENIQPDKVTFNCYNDGKKNIIFVGRGVPNKCQHDIVSTYAAFSKRYPDSRLLLVGGWLEGYRVFVEQIIQDMGLQEHVKILGGVSDAELKAIYASAHMFLCMSEHEGFCVPLLESMYFGVPIVAFAASAVPETLGDSGLLFYEKNFDAVAEMMSSVIEDEKLRETIIASQTERLKDFDIEKLKKTLFRLLSSLTERSIAMIYLDCSWIYKVPSDHAGMQRVTRSLVRELMNLRDDVCPAVLDQDGFFYKLTNIPMPSDAPFSHRSEPIFFMPGDIYIVLDTAWEDRILERLSPFKKYGITTGVFFHDVIPLTNSEVCGVDKGVFTAWVVETAKYADFFVCNSEATRNSLIREISELYPSRNIDDEIAFSFRLGANISTIDQAYRPNRGDLLNAFNSGDTYLIVSTVEPRKNHALLIDAFDILWKKFPHIKLCFIGKEGWMVENVVRRIRSHPKLNKNFFWFEGLTDDDVQWAYRKAKCVLYPSFEEGFGLPIVEALYSGTPVLASDIPVFHEVASDNIGYIDPHDPNSLVDWIARIEQNGIPEEILPDKNFKWVTWKESAEEMLQKMLKSDKVARQRLAPLLESDSFDQKIRLELLRMRDKEAVADVFPLTQQYFHDSLPSIRALPLKQLMKMNGRELIRHAYVRMLHRMPNFEDESLYLDKLMNGLPPISLIAALRFSDEGRRVGEPVKFAFLLQLIGRVLGTKRLIGGVARYFAAVRFLSGTRGMARSAIIQLQEIEAVLAKSNERMSAMNKEIDERMQETEAALAKNNERMSAMEEALAPPKLAFSQLISSGPMLQSAEKRVGVAAPTDLKDREKAFYSYFSEIWGDDNGETLRHHYEAYLPYLPLKSSVPFVDIGCGAGEFLSFMQGHGIKTLGVDSNEEEINRCLDKGLVAQCADAIDFLEGYDGELSGISLLQVIEHIPMDKYIRLLSLAHKKIADNGVLIIETINPMHPVAFDVFFSDPTHLRPVPSNYLAFLAQWCGFEKVDILRLYPVPILPSAITDSQFHYHNYAIMARKTLNETIN